MTKLLRTIGERLVQAREMAGYPSAEMFAKHLGLDPQRYRRYERGEVQAPYEVLLDITDDTGVSIHWLITGKGDPALSGYRQRSSRAAS